MVKFSLQIKAELENVEEMKPDLSAGYHWSFKLKCTNCGEVTEKWQEFDGEEEHEMIGSRGKAHFVMKCKFCSRDGNINVLKETFKQYTSENSESFATICQFECRSFEPVEFYPGKPWIVKSKLSNATFTDVDLSEDDFCEVDPKTVEPLGITGIESKFVKCK